MNVSNQKGLIALAAACFLMVGCEKTDEGSGPLRIDYAAIIGGDGATNEGVTRGDISEIYPDNTSNDLELHWVIEKPEDPPQYTVSWFISDDTVIDSTDIEISYSGCGSGFGNCPDETGTVFCSFDTNDVLDCGADVTSRHDLTAYFTANGGVGRYYLIMEASDSISPDFDTQVFQADFF